MALCERRLVGEEGERLERREEQVEQFVCRGKGFGEAGR